MNPVFYEIVGWLGTILILLAYFLVSFQKITANSSTYQFLNLFGAGFVVLNVFSHEAYPSVVLNSIWFCIALVGLIKIFKPKTS